MNEDLVDSLNPERQCDCRVIIWLSRRARAALIVRFARADCGHDFIIAFIDEGDAQG